MKRGLLSKNKNKFIDGSLPISQPGMFLHETRKRCNMMVIPWITYVKCSNCPKHHLHGKRQRNLERLA